MSRASQVPAGFAASHLPLEPQVAFRCVDFGPQSFMECSKVLFRVPSAQADVQGQASQDM